MFFNNKSATIYDEVEDAELCGVDGYGHPLKCTVETGTVTGDLQPLSNSESMKEFGSIVQDTYKMYIGLGTDVSTSSKLQFDGDDHYYQVMGIDEHNTLLPHIKLILKEERI